MQNAELKLVTEQNPDTISAFLNLGRDYLSTLPSEEREGFLQSILRRQREADRWLLLLRCEDEYLGFVHLKIDKDERPGWGFILEFYIIPDKRRLGWGRRLFQLTIEILKTRNVKNIRLLTNQVAEQFWHSLGFDDTGELDKETGQKILESTI